MASLKVKHSHQKRGNCFPINGIGALILAHTIAIWWHVHAKSELAQCFCLFGVEMHMQTQRNAFCASVQNVVPSYFTCMCMNKTS